MTEIDILECIKDTSNNVLGYIVKDNFDGYQFRLTVSELEEGVLVGEYIVLNATHIVGHGFKANNGSRIKVVTRSELAPVKKYDRGISKVSDGTFPNDYYGREFLNMCRRVRELARQNKIKIDSVFNRHSSNAGNNLHLFKLIESCGGEVENFLRGYLSVLQPYSLDYFQRETYKGTNMICVQDMGYRVALLIKLEKLHNQEYVLVSFHENNIVRNGKVVQGLGDRDFSNKLCAVLVDASAPSSLHPGYVDCSFIIQRGFVRQSIDVTIPEGHFVKNMALVSYDIIKTKYQDLMTSLLNELQSTYLLVNNETSENDGVITLGGKGVSFLSYGYTVTNNVCLLLDCFVLLDKSHRAVILELTHNLLSTMPQETLDELKYGLMDKYSRVVNYSNELYDQILYLCDRSIDNES